MDGVLVDTNPFHKQAWTAYAKQLGHSVTDNWMARNIYGKINRDAITSLLGSAPNETQLAAHTLAKESLFIELYKPHIALIPGLTVLLNDALAKGIPMAVATSAPRMNVEFIFRELGLRKYFPVVVDEEMVTRGKPDPEIYLKAAKALNRQPEECLVFEDSLAGVQAGLAAGMPVIAVATTHKAYEFSEVEKVIKDFRDFSLEDWWDGK